MSDDDTGARIVRLVRAGDDDPWARVTISFRDVDEADTLEELDSQVQYDLWFEVADGHEYARSRAWLANQLRGIAEGVENDEEWDR